MRCEEYERDEGFLITSSVFTWVIGVVLLFFGPVTCASTRSLRRDLERLEQSVETQKSLRPFQFTVHRLEIRPGGKYAIAKAGGYVKVNDETHWAMLKEGQSYRGLVSGDVLVRLEAK